MAEESEPPQPKVDRRSLIVGGFTAAGLVVGAGGAKAVDRVNTPSPGVAAPQMPATEDLMSDHGLLKRILLIYREASSRLVSGDQLEAADLFHAAQIVHDYIEGFHEGIEEGYVFPRLYRAGKLVDTVKTLLVQHDRGRKLTVSIIEKASPMSMAGMHKSPGFATRQSRAELAKSLDLFVRMYEPHEAREDTEVFPMFREITSDQEFLRVSDQVNEAQERSYGKDGFASFVEQITQIEKKLGINDLSLFTPPLP